MDKKEAQSKAIKEMYKEGTINKDKKPRYDTEGGAEHKESDGYRTKKNAKEEKGGLDKEGRMSKKCTSCGQSIKPQNVTDRV